MQITKVNRLHYSKYTNVNECNLLNINDIITFLKGKLQLTKVNFIFRVFCIIKYLTLVLFC